MKLMTYNLIFEEIHIENNRLDTEEAMIEFLSKVINTKFSWKSITVTVLKLELKKQVIWRGSIKLILYNFGCQRKIFNKWLFRLKLR